MALKILLLHPKGEWGISVRFSGLYLLFANRILGDTKLFWCGTSAGFGVTT
jgi:hypothetical protein